MGWRHSALGRFGSIGGFRLVERWFGRDRLTVLAYHRVVDHTGPDFVGFIGNASAGPEAFAEQMRVVSTEHNPVSIADVASVLDGEPLPDRAVLVTFDDGYRDNHDLALPILSEYSIPAVVFLATDYIGSHEPFWWDRVAWMFKETGPGKFDLPVLGPTSWAEPHEVTVAWVAAAKRLGVFEMSAAMTDLGAALGAPSIGSSFSGNLLDWDMVRAMQARNVAFGAHTCSHPILSRLDTDGARREIVDSAKRVAAETGRAPAGFAYPNGLPGDFDEGAVEAVRAAGIALGFTLSPGPARRREYLDDPLRIPRSYVHHADDLMTFRAKIAGVARLV